MKNELRFADSEALEDLRTYVARARALDVNGAIRLQSRGLTLAAYVGVEVTVLSPAPMGCLVVV